MAVASAVTQRPREGALVRNLRIVVLLVESNDPVLAHLSSLTPAPAALRKRLEPPQAHADAKSLRDWTTTPLMATAALKARRTHRNVLGMLEASILLRSGGRLAWASAEAFVKCDRLPPPKYPTMFTR
jgi:hypothetical protein